MSRRPALPGALAALVLSVCAASASAQEFSRYLACRGTITADDKVRDANAEFALRVNGRRALIQSSNVMPAGETMAYVPTPASYTMSYLLRPVGTKVLAVPGWFQNTVLVFFPNLRRLNQIRLSINRQTGALQGQLLNEEDELLGALAMQCTSQSDQEIAAPKI